MLGQKIYYELKRQGITQKELAEKVGMSPNSISLYIHKGKMPTAATLAKIAKILGTTTDYLLEDLEDEDTEFLKKYEDENTLGARIYEVLAKKGMRQTDLARLSGLSNSSISLYLNRGKMPKPSTLNKIAGALGVSADELLGKTDDTDVPEKEKVNVRLEDELHDERQNEMQEDELQSWGDDFWGDWGDYDRNYGDEYSEDLY